MHLGEQLQPAWIGLYQFCCNVSSFFFVNLLTLFQVNSRFPVQPQILRRIEIWTLTRPLQDINSDVLKEFLCSFGLYARAQCLAEERNFSQVIGLLQRASSFPSILLLLFYFNLYRMMLPPPCVCDDVCSVTWRLVWQPKGLLPADFSSPMWLWCFSLVLYPCEGQCAVNRGVSQGRTLTSVTPDGSPEQHKCRIM